MKPFTLLCVLSAEGFKVPDLGVKYLPERHIKTVIKDCIKNPLMEDEGVESRVDRLNLWGLNSPSKTWELVKKVCENQKEKFWVSAKENYRVYSPLLGKLREEAPGIDLETCEELIHYWKGRFYAE